MGRFFTYCWQHSEVLRYRDGELVAFAYGSQFARRGVGPGDEVYIVSVHRGRVHLLSKLLVRAVTPSAADCRRWAGVDPEPAAEYLLAEACTPARLVPLSDEPNPALALACAASSWWAWPSARRRGWTGRACGASVG